MHHEVEKTTVTGGAFARMMGFLSSPFVHRADKLPPRGVHRLEDPRYIFGNYIPDSDVGIDFSEGEVLGWPAMLQALRIIGWSLGQMPLQVYERDASGARKLTPADNHPLQRVLQEKPHPEYTPFEIKEGIGVNAAFRGDSFHQVARTNKGVVAEIFPLDYHRTRVERRKGQRWYLYNDGGREIAMRSDEVLHVSGLSDGGMVGFAIQQIAQNAMGKGLAMDRFGAKVFKNGASGNPIIEASQPYTFKTKQDEQEFIDKIKGKLAGSSNWHAPMTLPYGFTIKTLGITAKEAQLIEGLVYQIQDIARLTGVPPSLLMDNSHNTFTNSEQQFLQFIKMGLGGWIVKIEERMRLTLLSDSERSRYTIKFNADALLRTSLKERYESYRIACGVPFMSRNEARDLEDMEPVDGGNVIPDPLNMGDPGGNPDASGDAKAPPQDGDSGTRALSSSPCQCRHCNHSSGRDPREYRNAGRAGYLTAERREEVRGLLRERLALRGAFRKQIQRDAGRLVKAEIREVRKMMEKHLGTRADSDLIEALRKYFEGSGAKSFRAAVENIMSGTFRTYGEAVAAAVGQENGVSAPDVAQFIEDYMDVFIQRTAGSHFGQLEKLIRESDDPAEALDERLTEWDTEPRSQAEKIGAREAVQLGEAVARTGLVILGVSRLAWAANSGACPICEDLDGQIVGVDEVFVSKSEEIDPEADEVTPLKAASDTFNPPLHGGCECSLVAA